MAGPHSSFVSHAFVQRTGLLIAPDPGGSIRGIAGTSSTRGLVHVHLSLTGWEGNLALRILDGLGSEDVDILLGISWLREANPKIDWRMGTITFTESPSLARQRPECSGHALTESVSAATMRTEVEREEVEWLAVPRLRDTGTDLQQLSIEQKQELDSVIEEFSDVFDEQSALYTLPPASEDRPRCSIQLVPGSSGLLLNRGPSHVPKNMNLFAS